MKLVKNKSVLVVDDDQSFLEILARFMTLYGFDPVYQAGNGRMALELFEQHPVDLLITDINMPEISGMELMEQIREKDQDLPIIVISGWIKEDHLPLLEPYRVEETIFKPFRMESIAVVIERLFSDERPG